MRSLTTKQLTPAYTKQKRQGLTNNGQVIKRVRRHIDHSFYELQVEPPVISFNYSFLVYMYRKREERDQKKLH